MTARGAHAWFATLDFRVWSAAAQPDGYVDRIEWTFGVEPQAQVEAVVAGDADVAVEAWLSDSLEDLFVRFAAQVHTISDPDVCYVVLNTERRPSTTSTCDVR